MWQLIRPKRMFYAKKRIRTRQNDFVPFLHSKSKALALNGKRYANCGILTYLRRSDVEERNFFEILVCMDIFFHFSNILAHDDKCIFVVLVKNPPHPNYVTICTSCHETMGVTCTLTAHTRKGILENNTIWSNFAMVS